MDQNYPLIQGRDGISTPWYKRKSFIIGVGVCAIIAVVVIIVTVATVAVIVPGSRNKCSSDTSEGCFESDADFCQWCYTDKDGSGYCEGWRNDPATGNTPLNCVPNKAFLCQAYGFATHQDEATCRSFIPPGRSDPCQWVDHPQGCYQDSGNGPLGCCFD